MRTVMVNPPAASGRAFIREGRCMQRADSWAAIWPPITLAALAAQARGHGEVEIIDSAVEPGSSPEDLVARLLRSPPDVVVISTAFPSMEEDAHVAETIGEALPGTLVVGVGAPFSLLEGEVLEAFLGFDVAIPGEPESTFAELLERLVDGKSLEGTPGLICREGERVRTGPPRALPEDLDELPLPARDLLRNERYVLPHTGRPFTLIDTARGCPNGCSFCIAPIHNGTRVRRRSIDSVIEEIELCACVHGIRDFLLWEEAFTADAQLAHRFCETLIRRDIGVSWAATTRADLLDEPLLRRMKRSGLFLLGIGIESGCQSILDAAGKRIRVEDARKAVCLCRKVGVATMGHFVFGLPGETEETAELTIQYALSLGLDYLQCYVAVPFPKTPLGKLASERGWLESRRWADLDLGGASIMSTDTMTSETVTAFRDKLYKQFYLRPWYIMSRASRLARRPRQALRAGRFVSWMLRS